MRHTLDGVLRPDVKQFNRFLPHFLSNRPDLKCSKGYVLSLCKHQHKKTCQQHSMNVISFNSGLGAYDKAVVIGENGEIIGKQFKTFQKQVIHLDYLDAS